MDMNEIEMKFADDMRALTRRMELWAKYKHRLSPIMQDFQDAWADSYFNVGPFNWEINISGRMADLVAAISKLEAIGYIPISEVPEKLTTYFSTRFVREGYPDVLLYWSSTTCRKVQVGTKVEEVPVYEMRCDEE
jgi:hypothetical protein